MDFYENVFKKSVLWLRCSKTYFYASRSHIVNESHVLDIKCHLVYIHNLRLNHKTSSITRAGTYKITHVSGNQRPLFLNLILRWGHHHLEGRWRTSATVNWRRDSSRQKFRPYFPFSWGTSGPSSTEKRRAVGKCSCLYNEWEGRNHQAVYTR